MPAEISRISIKLGEPVFHVKPYTHPQLDTECPRDFFGRLGEKEDIISHLIDPESRQPVVVQGERRIGKTSMLKLVEKELRDNYQDAVVVPPRLDLRRPYPATSLFSHMIGLLSAELGVKGGKSPNTDLYPDPGRAMAVFKELASHTGRRSVVFIMDELDEILETDETSEKDRQAVLTLLNALSASDLPIKLFYSIIRTQARLRNIDFIKHLSEARVYSLRPLENNHAFREMVQTLADPDNTLNDGNISLLYKKSGGWPYFLKVVLWYYLQRPAGPRRLQQALDMAVRDQDAGASLAVTMSLIYKHHFDSEEKIIAKLLTDNNFLDLNEAADISPTLPAAARRMEGRHYLQRRNNGYKFRVGLLGDWFRHHRGELADFPSSSTKKRFEVALSFTSDHRDFVRDIARTLALQFGRDRVLFDEYYEAEFARPNLADYLPGLYDQAKLVVIFICENYYIKKWCRLEWSAIEKIITARPGAIMPVRFDMTTLAGWPTDELASGYLDVKERSAVEIAVKIMKRVGATP